MTRAELSRLLQEARADYSENELWRWDREPRDDRSPALKCGIYTALTLGDYWDGGINSHLAVREAITATLNIAPSLLALWEAAEEFDAHIMLNGGCHRECPEHADGAIESARRAEAQRDAYKAALEQIAEPLCDNTFRARLLRQGLSNDEIAQYVEASERNSAIARAALSSVHDQATAPTEEK